MTTFAGIFDPRDVGASATAALCRASGAEAPEVARLGALAVVGASSVGRLGATTCFFHGTLHDAKDVCRRLDLEHSATPAELVAAGYERNQRAFLRSLRGAYRFVIWDDARCQAVIGQDHLAAGAIFYHVDGRRIAFASEVAPLLRVLPQRPVPSQRAVTRWITERTCPDGLTLYDGVRRLRMGWAIRATHHGHRRECIWEPPCEPLPRLSASEAAGSIRSAVDRAVRRRLDGGPTGILLSGGFDSGTLAATAAPILRERGQSLPAYSSIFPGENWDESAGIDVLTSRFGLPSTRVRVTGGAVATAVNFQLHWDVPQPGPGGILDQPLFALAAQDGQRVMLDGQGGDELFAASWFLITDRVLRLRWREAWRLAHRLSGLGGSLSRPQARRLLTEIVLKGALPSGVHEAIARRREPPARPEWLRSWDPSASRELDERWAWKHGNARRPRWWSFLSYLLVEAREVVGLQDFLRRRGEMAGIDSRQPLLTDVDLVELMLKVPPELAFSPHYDRALAREAMRGLVPERVRLPEHKSDYSRLMHRTLAHDDLASIVRLLSQRDAEVAAYVDVELVRRQLLERPPGAGDPGWQLWGHHVWAIATAELWLRANALGSDFAGWAERLRFAPCRVEIMAAPRPVSDRRFTQPMFTIAGEAPASGGSSGRRTRSSEPVNADA